jgi:hypothetical protein
VSVCELQAVECWSHQIEQLAVRRMRYGSFLQSVGRTSSASLSTEACWKAGVTGWCAGSVM